MKNFVLLFLWCVVPTTALAVVDAGFGHGIQPTDGTRVRAQRSVAYQVPKSAMAAWSKFTAKRGTNWSALWDVDTKVPLRIFGQGLTSPGSSSSSVAAESAARSLLQSHLDLLAPGSALSDFSLVTNEVRGDLRLLAFEQHHKGVRVLGGQVSVYFRRDRLFVISSQALPFVDATIGNIGDSASKAAQQWLNQEYPGQAQSVVPQTPQILPLVNTSGIRYFHVAPFVADVTSPRSRWRVFVDTTAGQVVAKEQQLRFAETVEFVVPERWPGGPRISYPAAFANLVVDMATVVTDVAGTVTLTGTFPASITASTTGPYVRVESDSQTPNAQTTLSVDQGATTSWDASTEEEVDAQLNAFIHSNFAKEYARTLTNLTWIEQEMLVEVNLSGDCNAFSNGDSIHFLQGSSQCNNTALLADVVYHEFGHSIHSQSIVQGVGNFDGALSEGISDYYAATITDDHGMGRGFRKNNAPLRDINPEGSEAMWPRDVVSSVHTTGLIIGGTMWDLRTAMIDAHGFEQGKFLTDKIFIGIIERATDIPSSYVEALVTDDDDGDLSNGTPNKCLIDRTFAAHGLIEGRGLLGQLGYPIHDKFDIRIPRFDSDPTCPPPALESAVLRYRVQDADGDFAEVPMDISPSELVGKIAGDLGTNIVIEYQIVVETENGSSLTLPRNPADIYYELFVGEATEIYCHDFETDPFADGWTNGLDKGDPGQPGNNDWQWGPPAGQSSDPESAFSGNGVLGNDLGVGEYNGGYRPDVINWASSPKIDVRGYKTVRVQFYRWLTVEDRMFDQATIYGNNVPTWINRDYMGELHHRDEEWRFQDLDVTNLIGDDDKLQMKFEIESDAGFELGGWTIDKFCIVGIGQDKDALCGNGIIDDGEECDAGDAGSEECSTSCETLGPNTGCGCRSNKIPFGALFILAIGLLVLFSKSRRRE